MRRSSLVYLTAFAFLCIQCAQDNGSKRKGHTRIDANALKQQAARSNPTDNGNQPISASSVTAKKAAGVTTEKVDKPETLRDFLQKKADVDNSARVELAQLPLGTYTLKEMQTSFEVQDSTKSSVAADASGKLNQKSTAMNYIEIEGFTIAQSNIGGQTNFDVSLQSSQVAGTLAQGAALPARTWTVETLFKVVNDKNKVAVRAVNAMLLGHQLVKSVPQTATQSTAEKSSALLNVLNGREATNGAYQNVYNTKPQSNAVFLSLVSPTELHVLLEITESTSLAAVRRVYLTYAIVADAPTTAVAPADDASKVTQLSTLPPKDQPQAAVQSAAAAPSQDDANVQRDEGVTDGQMDDTSSPPVVK